MFPTTRWSLVLAARSAELDAREALNGLCLAYREPVLRFLRRTAQQPADAEDLTQAFFAEFIEHTYHAKADPARGRFRSLLLTQLKRFVAKVERASAAQKRGGGSMPMALDGELVAPEALDPLQAFERDWSITVLTRAWAALEAEARAHGKVELLKTLTAYVLEPPDADDYARASAALDLSRNAVAVTVARLRQRLAELVRAEVSETVQSGDELNSELDVLQRHLGLTRVR